VNDLALKAYWAAPYWAKCLAASRHARHLNRQRFGPAFDRCLRAVEQRTAWGAERWNDYQSERLRVLVRHAVDNIPYYRALFEESGLKVDDIRDVDDLKRIPILNKATVREKGRELVDERLKPDALLNNHTSGTTNTPLRLYWNADVFAAASAYMQARCFSVAGVRQGQNSFVSLGGHLVAGPRRKHPPFWVHNRTWKQLYMSSYHLSPRNLPAYVHALRAFGGEWIEGYPSSVYALARFIVDEGLPPVPFQACVTTAELLSNDQRETIREAFQCRTYNQYGCAEFVIFAAECADGALHISPDVGIVEILDDQDKPLPPGKVGHLVCTGLENFVQPLVRYRLGDLAALKVGACSCGSPLPALSFVEGRRDAVLITSDGRRIGRLDPVFKGCQGITAAQIVQEAHDDFLVRIVPSPAFAQRDAETVIRNLAARVGRARIRTELVTEIERTPRGKLQPVVCKLKDTERVACER